MTTTSKNMKTKNESINITTKCKYQVDEQEYKYHDDHEYECEDDEQNYRYHDRVYILSRRTDV